MKQPHRVVAVLLTLGTLIAFSPPAHAYGSSSKARVRVVHASPDAPAVDVLVNDQLAFADVAFGDTTDYAPVPAGVYNVKVVPAGSGPGAAVIEADLNLFYNTNYTVVAVNTLAQIEALVLTDSAAWTWGNKARVRFVHASPDAPAVDIRVTGGPFAFQGVSFKGVGDYVEFPRGTYSFEVRVAGTDTVVLDVPNVRLRGGRTYTLYALGFVGGQPGLRVALSQDARTLPWHQFDDDD